MTRFAAMIFLMALLFLIVFTSTIIQVAGRSSLSLRPPSMGGQPPKNKTYADKDAAGPMAALLDKYAPIVKLASTEQYYPSSIEYMLNSYSYVEFSNGTMYEANASILTNSSLDQSPLLGFSQFMSVVEPHNPQPLLEDEESAFLYGPAGLKGGMGHDESGRGIVKEDVYGLWVDQGRGVVDLWYWTFYPYNFGKSIGAFGILGNHVADWEHLRVRTINGTAVSADFNAHSGTKFGAGTLRWEDIEKIDDRPVAYSASGSHGIWPNVGNHVYIHVLGLRLIDVTDDEGAVWDTKGRVVPAQYWSDSYHRRKIWQQNESSWLNFRGHWGNRGDTDCWWHPFIGICQVVDAPPGPNRAFGFPPDCIVSPLANETSTFSFYLSEAAVQYAHSKQITLVRATQVCGKPAPRGDEYDMLDQEDNVLESHLVLDPHHEDYYDPTYLPNTDDDEDHNELELEAMRGTTPFVGRDKHTVRIKRCSGSRSAVEGYSIALCVRSGHCISASPVRKLCTYAQGEPGYQFGPAVDVDDLDDWLWKF